MNDKSYTKSIGAFAGSRTTYDIHGIFNEFTAIIGVDDKSRVSDNSEGMVFIVEGDGKVIYRSKSMKLSDKPLNISVNISSVRKLVLTSESTGDNSRRRFGLMGNWADPLIKK